MPYAWQNSITLRAARGELTCLELDCRFMVASVRVQGRPQTRRPLLNSLRAKKCPKAGDRWSCPQAGRVSYRERALTAACRVGNADVAGANERAPAFASQLARDEGCRRSPGDRSCLELLLRQSALRCLWRCSPCLARIPRRSRGGKFRPRTSWREPSKALLSMRCYPPILADGRMSELLAVCPIRLGRRAQLRRPKPRIRRGR